MASVQITNVTKVYDKNVVAVKNINLSIDDQEFVVLVGPSGCGKSTLLRMIAGLEEITSGDISINGKVVNDVAPKYRDIAMVFQNYALYPHMSVYENMAFGLKLKKFSKDEIKQRVLEAAEILDISDYLDRKPKALSGGQRQRVAVGRAIVRKPKVFLFDEPLSNLDAKLRVAMRIEISRLHNRLKTTMIYVTHDQIEAMTMGSKIVVLKDGEIHQVDTPLNLYNKPLNKFVGGFIGSPSMNFFYGQILRKGQLTFQSKALNFTIPEKKAAILKNYQHQEVIIGIRPEDIMEAGEIMPNNCSEVQKIEVDVVEPVGNEIFTYFNDDTSSHCMRNTSDNLHHAGQILDIAVRLDKIHFFDVKSEKVIA